LDTTELPGGWKEAFTVTPIYRKSDLLLLLFCLCFVHKPANYHPAVSVTSAYAKINVMEHVNVGEIMDHLETSNVLCSTHSARG